MKPSREKDFIKKGTFPLHSTRNGLARSSSKKQNQPNPNNTNPNLQGPRYSKDTDYIVEVTPLNKQKDETDDEANNNTTVTTKTPPVEASVSPELQMMLKSTAATTPATGYHIHTAISGITDNRKCRARGLLAATNTLTDGENVLPLPSRASMHWLDRQSPTPPFSASNSSCNTNGSSGSANVIRTPTSADSDSSVTYLDALLNKTSQFRSQLDSVAFSFEFDTVGASAPPSSSVDLTHFRPQLRNSCCSSEIDDIDQFDFCRCSSDDEEPSIIFNDIVPPVEPEARRQNYASGSCAESISTDGGGPLASKDSDWDFVHLPL